MLLENILGTQRRAPDILDCLANLSSDEVFTPPNIAGRMLDLLPSKVWTDPTLRWLDPACKSGVFLREAAGRLMVGLAEHFPDEAERREHIFKNMMFGVAITELTALITRRSLYYSKDASGEYAVVPFSTPAGNIVQRRSEHKYVDRKCVICGSPDDLDAETRAGLENYAYTFIHEEDIFDMKFDVIIGNPPYQLEGKNENRDVPIYQHFVSRAIAMQPKFCIFIIPARWYVGGMGLGEFRAQMLGDKRIRTLVDYPNAAEVFPGVDIKGGVCYFLWDREYSGDCTVSNIVDDEQLLVSVRPLDEEDVFVRFNQALTILEKVRLRGEEVMSSQVSTGVPFGMRSNFSDFKDEPFEGSVKLFRRGGVGYIRPEQVTRNSAWIKHWKVLIPNAGDGSGSFPIVVLGRPLVVSPGTACTQTYLVAGTTGSKAEAENLAAYMQTRFFRYLVSLRKTTQHASQGVYAYAPKLDMTKAWTDEELYERYQLSEQEIAHIESQIKEML